MYLRLYLTKLGNDFVYMPTPSYALTPHEIKLLLVQEYFHDITITILNIIQDPSLLTCTSEILSNKILLDLTKIETTLLSTQLSEKEFLSIQYLFQSAYDYADGKVKRESLLTMTTSFGKNAPKIIDMYEKMIAEIKILENLFTNHKMPKSTNYLIQYQNYKDKYRHLKIALMIGIAIMALAFVTYRLNKPSLNYS